MHTSADGAWRGPICARNSHAARDPIAIRSNCARDIHTRVARGGSPPRVARCLAAGPPGSRRRAIGAVLGLASCAKFASRGTHAHYARREVPAHYPRALPVATRHPGRRAGRQQPPVGVPHPPGSRRRAALHGPRHPELRSRFAVSRQNSEKRGERKTYPCRMLCATIFPESIPGTQEDPTL